MVRMNSDDEDWIANRRKVLAEKKKEKKTFVFDIELTEYTNDNYAEYNWKSLVQREEDKDRDSDIEIIEVEVHEGGQKKKKQGPADPEDDYDLEDDFIDDSEVNDEEVPAEVSTAHGGFYINTGSLKFKVKDMNSREESKKRSNGCIETEVQDGGLKKRKLEDKYECESKRRGSYAELRTGGD